MMRRNFRTLLRLRAKSSPNARPTATRKHGLRLRGGLSTGMIGRIGSKQVPYRRGTLILKEKYVAQKLGHALARQ
jgi:hypothetical protein